MYFSKEVFRKKYLCNFMKFFKSVIITFAISVIATIICWKVIPIFAIFPTVLSVILFAIFASSYFYVQYKQNEYLNYELQLFDNEIHISNMRRTYKGDYNIFEEIIIRNIDSVRVSKKYITVKGEVYYFRDVVDFPMSQEISKHESVHKIYDIGRVFKEEDKIIEFLKEKEVEFK
jgi:hypothetical protein